MIEVRKTDEFAQWLDGLRDGDARAKIDARLLRLSLGNPGDVKSVGGRVSEVRVDHGPGYRVYFTRRGMKIVVLLCGGDKRTQAADIKRARDMVARLD
ncbi:type II toxin-antitoxin system RelE/ParE family toxin [Vineibacter terrae]|uniref:Type II toxin-antitoxin system RelE/ParE family toxin n=1 Tax=Vineibacter terrae TaxID=2586908 RepID=A0A5C8PSS0_9HYPH|nr:type II toxin-antitoxin system RelE/ParE family toxin [Vineibacter terrae]TXL80400.1 type II toxin-antitoxin system RelE/ParE family toxin [Vineibacter terrae]